jgi:hypothetical protein
MAELGRTGSREEEYYKPFQNLFWGVILNQPDEFKQRKNHPPFLKGGRGD